jgi:hypothetical protein
MRFMTAATSNQIVNSNSERSTLMLNQPKEELPLMNKQNLINMMRQQQMTEKS